MRILPAIALAFLSAIASLGAQQEQARFEYSPTSELHEKRFQMFFSPYQRDDTYYVDTAFGQVWRLEQAADGHRLLQQLVVNKKPVPSYRGPNPWPATQHEIDERKRLKEPAALLDPYAQVDKELRALYDGPREIPGEFVIVYGPVARADTFLVDTIGGGVWEMAAAKEGEQVFQSVDLVAVAK